MVEQVFIRQTQNEVTCDGGGQFGHPKIYLSLATLPSVTCPYCSKEFVKESPL